MARLQMQTGKVNDPRARLYQSIDSPIDEVGRENREVLEYLKVNPLMQNIYNNNIFCYYQCIRSIPSGNTLIAAVKRGACC